MKTKGQHRGHCQACGAVQVVESTNNIAKHGYKVAGFGYFSGTCMGAGELPLEHERRVTDAIILDLVRKAQKNDVRAIALRAGALTPTHAQQLDQYNQRVWTWVGVGRERGREAVMVSWRDASTKERALQVEQDASECESFSRFARGHIKMLNELIERVHGTQLIDRDAEELARVAERKAKSAPIEGAYRTKRAQKNDLDTLNREYSKLRQIIIDRYLGTPSRVRGDAGEDVYYATPFDLHQWREKTSLLVLKVYPDMNDIVNQIRGLVVAREVIKSRPVIK